MSSKEKSLLVRRFDPNEEGMVRAKAPKMLAARDNIFSKRIYMVKGPTM